LSAQSNNQRVPSPCAHGHQRPPPVVISPPTVERIRRIHGSQVQILDLAVSHSTLLSGSPFTRQRQVCSRETPALLLLYSRDRSYKACRSGTALNWYSSQLKSELSIISRSRAWGLGFRFSFFVGWRGEHSVPAWVLQASNFRLPSSVLSGRCAAGVHDHSGLRVSCCEIRVSGLGVRFSFLSSYTSTLGDI